MDLALVLILGLVAGTILVAFVYFADRVARDRWGAQGQDTTDDQPLRLPLFALTPEEFARFGLPRVDEVARVAAGMAARASSTSPLPPSDHAKAATQLAAG